MKVFDFYNKFIQNGEVKMLPFIPIEYADSFKTEIWNKIDGRLDNISYKYYGTPFMYRFILMANAHFGIDENDIPDGAIIFIPYPLEATIQQYLNKLNQFEQLNTL
jgi:hypothetical protein